MGIYVVKRATRLPGTPHSIAAGAACGVASSFTPFIGLHLLGSLLLCLLVRGNYLAAVVGTLVGNPWTLPFIWVTAYHLGHALLGTHGTELEAVQDWDFAALMGELEAVFWPVAVGSVPLGLIGGLATYFPLMRMIAAYQQARRNRRARRQQDRLGAEAQRASSDLRVS
ncbi:MAG TPA: DUF2062 domain-containing protein [Geminicoccaceae bacterium]|jgi:hypothetical protein|nr:DUF2062 domain-containing protein [Geminicoccaceae bacterium]